MLAFADHDAASTRHIAEFFALLVRALEKFLDDPMTKPQGGEAAAASQVSQ